MFIHFRYVRLTGCHVWQTTPSFPNVLISCHHKIMDQSMDCSKKTHSDRDERGNWDESMGQSHMTLTFGCWLLKNPRISSYENRCQVKFTTAVVFWCLLQSQIPRFLPEVCRAQRSVVWLEGQHDHDTVIRCGGRSSFIGSHQWLRIFRSRFWV